jgi:agmatinase
MLLHAFLLLHTLYDGACAADRNLDTDKWDFEWSFSGIETFAHLPHVKCLTNPNEAFDIGIIGAPL